MYLNRSRSFTLIALAILFITACRFSFITPEEYFDKAALNTNMLSRFGGDYFNTYQKYIKGGGNTDAFNSCEKYLKNYSIATAERDLKKVKELYPDKEAQPMIDASVDLYTYVLQSYKTDHLEIARMIDQKESALILEKAISALNQKSYGIFAKKYDKLWSIAKTYAKSNGIEVKEMPF